MQHQPITAARPLGNPALRPGAVHAAATAIITATHGPRPTIGVFARFSADSVATSRVLDQFKASMDSAAAASAWDRKVTALTRAIVAEKRVLL